MQLNTLKKGFLICLISLPILSCTDDYVNVAEGVGGAFSMVWLIIKIFIFLFPLMIGGIVALVSEKKWKGFLLTIAIGYGAIGFFLLLRLVLN